MDWIERELEALREENLFRRRTVAEGLKVFCSNDYLGFRRNPRILEAVKKALNLYGLGSGASQLVSGYTDAHRDLEERLARFKGTPSCVLFGSGYLANVGTIPALAGEGDLILSDELNHASIIDACRLSKAKRLIFKHRDYNHLEDLLKRERNTVRRVLIVTDSVFSMDGDIADVKTLYEICERYDCMLYIDDAHGTGTIGKGRGVLEKQGLKWKEFVILMGTLSKALGSYGAFVCGSERLIEWLVNRSRSLIFSTSLPPLLCVGALEAIKILEEDPFLVDRLRDMEKKLVEGLSSLGKLSFKYFRTPIIPIMVGDEGKALEIAASLRRKGVFLQAIRYPTVPKGEARLRLTASLSYTEEDVDFLLSSLEEILK